MPLFKNKILIYLITRYLTYGIQFLTSLIIAWKINPYYMGIYGTILLVQSYFTYINFGIPNSLNVFLVKSKESVSLQNKYILNSYALYTILNIIIIISWLILEITDSPMLNEHNISLYYPYIIGIAILTYYNSLNSTIIRFKGQINLLSIIGSIPVLFNIVIVWLFKEEYLVRVIVITNLIANIAIFIIYKKNNITPTLRIENIEINTQKEILRKGIYLFAYNSCFYFILIAVRTIVSSNYSIQEFGYFTFAFTIANAVLLLLDSLNTIIFPKSIDILSSGETNDKIEVLRKLRIGYIITSHFLIYIAMCIYPFFLHLFPNYRNSLDALNIISLAVLMNTNGYGYTTLLIAENKEKILSYLSCSALIISITVGLILGHYLKVDYSFVVVAILTAYLYFSFMISYIGNKILNIKDVLHHTAKSFFSIRMVIPYITALLISIFKFEILVWTPLVLFIIFNHKEASVLKVLLLKLVKNPNIADV